MAYQDRRGRLKFGSLTYDDDTGVNIVVTTAGTFYEIKSADFTALSHKLTTSASAGTITCPKGTYEIQFAISGTGEASDLLEAVVHYDTTATEIAARHDFPASGMTDVSIAGGGVIKLASEADISVKITSNTNADSLDVRAFSLVVKQIG